MVKVSPTTAETAVGPVLRLKTVGWRVELTERAVVGGATGGGTTVTGGTTTGGAATGGVTTGVTRRHDRRVRWRELRDRCSAVAAYSTRAAPMEVMDCRTRLDIVIARLSCW